MIDEAMIEKAVEMLREAAPGAKVILFGSYANGEAREDSDVDFMVVEPEVESRRAEAGRLEDALRPLGILADVHLTSEETFDYWAGTPGTLYYEAAEADGGAPNASPRRSREFARLLLDKARESEYVVGVLANDQRCGNGAIGFHAHRAIQHCLEAVLVVQGVRHRHTYKIDELVRMLRSRGIDVPEYVESAEKLNPYAAEFHEGVLVDPDAVSFETSWAIECVRRTREWAERLVRGE